MAINDHSDFFIYIPMLNNVETLAGITTTEREEQISRQKENNFPLPDKEWIKILFTSHFVVYAHLWDKQMLEETPF